MTHQQAKKELEAGTPPELVCAACPWDRLCVQPPTMSRGDVDRLINEAEVKDTAKGGMPTGALMTALVFAGKDTAGPMCPVFALRLRSPDGRRVADAIRTLMRSFDEES